MATWTGTAVAVADEVALVRPRAARLLADALDTVAGLQGVRLSTEAGHIRDVLRHVANHAAPDTAEPNRGPGAGGHADTPDVRNRANSTPWTHEHDGIDWITTTEAGELLRCTARHVGRLAHSGELSTRKHGNRRLVDRAEVLELAIERSTT